MIRRLLCRIGLHAWLTPFGAGDYPGLYRKPGKWQKLARQAGFALLVSFAPIEKALPSPFLVSILAEPDVILRTASFVSKAVSSGDVRVEQFVYRAANYDSETQIHQPPIQRRLIIAVFGVAGCWLFSFWGWRVLYDNRGLGWLLITCAAVLGVLGLGIFLLSHFESTWDWPI